MNLLQKQKEMNTSPSVCNPTVAPPWHQFGIKWELSVNPFHCYLNAMMWSWKRTRLTRFWWWPLKTKGISFPHAWNITSYWCYFFLPFLLDEVATYSRSNMWIKQKLYETHTTHWKILHNSPYMQTTQQLYFSTSLLHLWHFSILFYCAWVGDASFFYLDNEHAGNTRKSHKCHTNVHAQQHIWSVILSFTVHRPFSFKGRGLMDCRVL